MDPLTTALVGSLVAIVAAVAGFFFAAARSRRSMGDAETTSEQILAEARLNSQRILRRAEEEARAKAETYRNREDATLEHKRIEVKS